jgi:hypothetical protein
LNKHGNEKKKFERTCLICRLIEHTEAGEHGAASTIIEPTNTIKSTKVMIKRAIFLHENNYVLNIIDWPGSDCQCPTTGKEQDERLLLRHSHNHRQHKLRIRVLMMGFKIGPNIKSDVIRHIFNDRYKPYVYFSKN